MLVCSGIIIVVPPLETVNMYDDSRCVLVLTPGDFNGKCISKTEVYTENHSITGSIFK